MAKKKQSSVEITETERLERIKRQVVIAIFSDDFLMERLVLKGGNAINLLLDVGTRASVDIDLSMESDFPPEEREKILKGLESRLQATFAPDNLTVFDVTLEEKPETISPEVATFWGGYDVTFKLIENHVAKKCAGDLTAMRRNSLRIGAKGKFEIDISKFEYCAPKRSFDMDGLQVFVYTTEMLVAEKLRAICQQMPEYGPVVKRTRPGSARARDFFDIHSLVHRYKLEMASQENLELVRLIFEAKRVPPALLGKIRGFREFHRPDFQSVKDTVKPGVTLQSFDFYFDFVLKLAEQLLKALGNE
jgi:hypothetical protein